MLGRVIAGLLLMSATAAHAVAAEPVLLHAAGSLRFALTEVAASFEKAAVGADYGLTVMAAASPSAYQFAMFILSADGQRVLAKYGFAAPTLPQ
jgi:ABC-type molybdate transport system substrate-binding protein